MRYKPVKLRGAVIAYVHSWEQVRANLKLLGWTVKPGVKNIGVETATAFELDADKLFHRDEVKA